MRWFRIEFGITSSQGYLRHGTISTNKETNINKYFYVKIYVLSYFTIWNISKLMSQTIRMRVEAMLLKSFFGRDEDSRNVNIQS